MIDLPSTWMKVRLDILVLHFMNIKYRISSNKRPRRLFSYKASRWGAYWRAVLERGRRLFQCKQGRFKYEIWDGMSTIEVPILER